MPLRKTVAETSRLIEVAQGLAPADLYVSNAQVVNVYSGEVIPANVAVAGGRVAYVGNSEKMVGQSTQVLDAAGHYLVPGFLEPHTHLDVGYNPTTLSMEMLMRGTTGLFASTSPLQSNMTLPAFRSAIDELLGHPARVFTGLYGDRGIQVNGAALSEEAIASELFGLDGVYGLSEVNAWPRLLARDQEMLQRFAFVRRQGKTLEGHTAGANAEKLNPIAAGGYTSCHEPINVSQALDRLRLGLHVMLRHNNIRPDLPELVKLLTENKISPARLMWTADGIQAPFLKENGHLDFIIRYAVEMGADPITAIQMATINPATYFGLDGEIGGIAPGRLADLLVVKDLRAPTPETVISSGRVVIRDRELVIDYPEPAYYEHVRNRYTDPGSAIRHFTPKMFLVPAQSDMEFPVVRLSSSVLTKRQDTLLHARDGYLACDPEREILHYAVLDVRSGKIGCGFVTGLGFCPEGMVFTNIVTGQLGAWGTRPEEIARAGNHALKLGGGIVIMHGGQAAFEMPLSLTGCMSTAPMPQLAAQMLAYFDYMHSHGFPYDDPFYTTRFVGFEGLPEIRLTVRGVVESRTGTVLFPATATGRGGDEAE